MIKYGGSLFCIAVGATPYLAVSQASGRLRDKDSPDFGGLILPRLTR